MIYHCRYNTKCIKTKIHTTKNVSVAKSCDFIHTIINEQKNILR